jgi:hypothetical protein
MDNFESSVDPDFAQTVRNRLDAIARMGASSPGGAPTPLVGADSAGQQVSELDELTRVRPPVQD